MSSSEHHSDVLFQAAGSEWADGLWYNQQCACCGRNKTMRLRMCANLMVCVAWCVGGGTCNRNTEPSDMPIKPPSKNGPHQDRSEKVVGAHGAGQQTHSVRNRHRHRGCSCSGLQRSRMRAHRRQGSSVHWKCGPSIGRFRGWRNGDGRRTEKRGRGCYRSSAQSTERRRKQNAGPERWRTVGGRGTNQGSIGG